MSVLLDTRRHVPPITSSCQSLAHSIHPSRSAWLTILSNSWRYGAQFIQSSPNLNRPVIRNTPSPLTTPHFLGTAMVPCNSADCLCFLAKWEPTSRMIWFAKTLMWVLSCTWRTSSIFPTTTEMKEIGHRKQVVLTVCACTYAFRNI